MRISKLLSAVLLSSFALACTPNKEVTSKVSIRMPGGSSSSSNKMSQSVSALGWNEMCYFVNITGGSLSAKKKNSCEIEKGLTSGFIAAGSEVSMSIPQGLGYKLQLIGFERVSNTGPCPTINADSDFETLDQSKLKELAVQSFDTTGDETKVELNAVSTGPTLQSQYSLTSYCSVPSPATIAISDASYNFGTKANASTSTKVFTLTNSGGSPATSMSPVGLAAPYSIASTTCGSSLSSGAQCTVTVDFSPTATGTHTDSLEVSFNDGFAAQTSSRLITGSSIEPAILSISDGATYEYGSRPTGSATSKTFTVTNSGGSTANSIAIGGLAAPYSRNGGTCGTSLGSGGLTCTIIIDFAPTATGLHSDTIDIAYNDGVAAATSSRDVQGTGVSPALLALDVSSFDFENVATSGVADHSFTVTNSGGVNAASMTGAALSAPFSWKGGSYPGTGGTCAASLAPGADCTIIISYSPSADGPHSDTATVSYHDGVAGSQTASSTVDGTGVYPFTWTGAAADANWSTGGNWMGGSAPGTVDIAVFDGTFCSGGDCNVTFDTSVTVLGIHLKSNFTGSITDTSYGMTLGSAGFVQENGTFDMSAVAGVINIDGPTKLSGGTFRTGAYWTTASFEKSGTPVFNHSSGNFKITGTSTAGCGVSNILANGQSFYNLTLYSTCSRTFDLNNQNLEVTNTLQLSGGDFRRGKIKLTGTNLTVGDFSSSMLDNGVLEFASSSHTNITASGGALPNINFNMSGAFAAKINGTLLVRGNVTRSGQGSFGYLSSNIDVIRFETPYQVGVGCADTNLDLTNSNFGSVHFSNLCNSPENVFNISGSPWIYGTLRFAPTPTAGTRYPMRLSGGTLQVEGGSAYVDHATMRGGSTLVKMKNNNTATLSGVTGGKFPSVEIAKPAGQLVSFSGEIGIAEDLIYTSGSMITGSSTLVLYNLGATPATVNFPNPFSHVIIRTVENSHPTLDLASNLNAINLTFEKHPTLNTCMGVSSNSLIVTGNLHYNCVNVTTGTGSIIFSDDPYDNTIVQNWTMAASGNKAPAKIKISRTAGSVVMGNTFGSFDLPYQLHVDQGILNANAQDIFSYSGFVVDSGGYVTNLGAGSLGYGGHYWTGGNVNGANY